MDAYLFSSPAKLQHFIFQAVVALCMFAAAAGEADASADAGYFYGRHYGYGHALGYAHHGYYGYPYAHRGYFYG